jgi:hypothetical protein
MNFGSTDGGPSAIVGCRFSAQPGQIEGSIDHAHQMIARNRLAEVKLVKQLTLIDLQPSNHGERSLMFSQQERNRGITAYHLPEPTSATKLHQRLQNSSSYPRLRFERSIKKSSIFLPALSCATIHRGCLPRPAQVSDGSEGFRNLGTTGG